MARRRWGLGPAKRTRGAGRRDDDERLAAVDELHTWVGGASDRAHDTAAADDGAAPWIGTAAPPAPPAPASSGPNPFLPPAATRRGSGRRGTSLGDRFRDGLRRGEGRAAATGGGPVAGPVAGPWTDGATAPQLGTEAGQTPTARPRRQRKPRTAAAPPRSSGTSKGPAKGATKGPTEAAAAGTAGERWDRPAIPRPATSQQATSRPATSRPAQPVKRGGRASAGTRRSGRLGWALVAVAVVVGAVIAVALLVNRPLADLGGPEIPLAPGEPAAVIEPTLVWESWAMDVTPYGVSGSDPGGPSGIVTADAVVVRTGGPDDVDTIAVLALGRATGSTLWTVDLPGAVCATDPLELPEAASGQVVVCAGRAEADGAPSRLILLDQASGAVVVEGAFDGQPGAIAVSDGGVVVVERADPATARTSIRWFSLAGEQLWQEDLVELAPPEAKDAMLRGAGYELWAVDWARHGDALFLSAAVWAHLRLDPAGAETIEDWAGQSECYGIYLTEELVVCGGYDLLGLTPDGEVRWSGSEPMVTRMELEQPALLATCPWCDDDELVYQLDPSTGERLREVAALPGIVTLTGSAKVPLLRGSDRIVGLTEGGGRALWARPFDSDYGSFGITVVGDRIVLPSNEMGEPDVVLDAATGAETMRAPLGLLTPVGGRQALQVRAGDVALIELS